MEISDRILDFSYHDPDNLFVPIFCFLSVANLWEAYNPIECIFAFMRENCEFMMRFTSKPNILQSY